MESSLLTDHTAGRSALLVTSLVQRLLPKLKNVLLASSN